MDNEKPKPKGKALRWTPAQMDALSEVSVEDIARGKALVDRYGSALLRGLFRAKGKESKK